MGEAKSNILFYTKIAIIIIVLFLSTAVSYGQQYNLLFKHLTTNDGLSNNTVLSITQDSDGFMWFGTMNGVNKYDGYEFTHYEFNTTEFNSIGSNIIVRIVEDSYGTIWFSSDDNGLYIYNKETENFLQLSTRSTPLCNISSNSAREVFEDSERNLWVGTIGGGLNLFNREDSTFTSFQHNPDDSNSIGSNNIVSIAEDKNGNLWLGSVTGELIKFDKANLSFTNYNIVKDKYMFLYNVSSFKVYVDSDNDVWYGTLEGAFILNQKTGKIKHLQSGNTKYNLNSNLVSSILEYKKGLFFIPSDYGGLNVYNKATGEVSYHKAVKYDNTTISNNQINSTYRASDGTVWFACFNSGLNILNDQLLFHQYKYKIQSKDRLNCCNSTLAICDDLDGNIWLGYDGNGIDIYSPETNKTKHITVENNPINSNIVQSIYRDNSGNMWIGHYIDGISIYDWKSKTFSSINHIVPYDFNLNNIRCILQDNEKEFWIGTHGSGLKLLNLTDETYTIFQQSSDDEPNKVKALSNNYINKLFKDSKGRLWVGSADKLNRYVPGVNEFIWYDESKGIREKFINDIFEDVHGDLWVGTTGGLYLYNPQQDNFTNFSNEKSVNTIFEDDISNLWVSTKEGISKFNIYSKIFRDYNTSDGIQNMGFYYNSGVKSKEGVIYFGGQNGFTSFNPEKTIDHATPPAVIITELKVSNIAISHKDTNSVLKKHINFTDTIILNHTQNNLHFKFSTLNHVDANKSTYKYILEGFDKDWVVAKSSREANYTNLNPGTYLFKVKGSNNSRTWSKLPKVIVITVTPPFWHTIWFIILMVLVVILLIHMIIKLRSAKHKRDSLKLHKIIDERTKEVQSQNRELSEHKNNLELKVEERTSKLNIALSKAQESDKLKLAFLSNMSHEIRTPLNAIVGFSSLISMPGLDPQDLQKYTTIINSNSDSLLMLIDDILDLSRIEANQLTIHKEQFSVNELMDNLFSNSSMNNTNSKIEIVLNNKLDNQLLEVNSDELRIKQIMNNLVQNANKFTKQGSIEIGADVEDSNLVLYVKDTGIGISEENQKLIFQRFIRSNDENINDYRGVGLGLSISTRLAEMLDGTLTLKSKLGSGSTFLLAFPLSKML